MLTQLAALQTTSKLTTTQTARRGGRREAAALTHALQHAAKRISNSTESQ
jgi:hypothetical protein